MAFTPVLTTVPTSTNYAERLLLDRKLSVSGIDIRFHTQQQRSYEDPYGTNQTIIVATWFSRASNQHESIHTPIHEMNPAEVDSIMIQQVNRILELELNKLEHAIFIHSLKEHGLQWL